MSCMLKSLINNNNNNNNNNKLSSCCHRNLYLRGQTVCFNYTCVPRIYMPRNIVIVQRTLCLSLSLSLSLMLSTLLLLFCICVQYFSIKNNNNNNNSAFQFNLLLPLFREPACPIFRPTETHLVLQFALISSPSGIEYRGQLKK